jgi:alpha-beta hydrolase superfamily lysophospholipase
MTLADQDVPVLAWDEPDGLIPRGTVVVIPGRGEPPTVYERFGRRLAADAYRVRVVADPVVDAELARAQVSGLLADPGLPAPRVLAGSDTGALFAIMLARSGLGAAVDALLLAGLPGTPQAGPAASWEEELDARTSCPAHRGRLTASAVRRGALYEPIPAGWLERADLDGLGVPILGVHGSDDPVSPLGRVRDRYAAAPSAELVSITAGRHDVLNDQTHRTVAAVVVLFLERIRQDSGPGPIAVPEELGR